jgi:hypothetical protein
VGSVSSYDRAIHDFDQAIRLNPSDAVPANRLTANAAEALSWSERSRPIPVLLTGPLEGKQIHVGRVALHECLTCGHLMPTAARQAKVERNVEMGIRLFLGQLH